MIRMESDPIVPKMLQPQPPQELVTVRDAIADLPGPISEIKAHGEFGWARYPSRAVHRLTEYAQRLRSLPPIGLGWSEAVELHQNGFVSGLVETRHSGRGRATISSDRVWQERIRSPNPIGWSGAANARQSARGRAQTKVPSNPFARCILERVASSPCAKARSCQDSRIGSCSIRQSGIASE